MTYREKPTVKRARKRMAADDLACALQIVSEADKYGGESALAVQWARRVIEAQASPQRFRSPA